MNYTEREMMELRIISYILKTGDLNILAREGVDLSFFEKFGDCLNFIFEFKDVYNSVPSIDRVMGRFDIDIFEVNNETVYYDINELKEFVSSGRTLSIISDVVELYKSDPEAARNFLYEHRDDFWFNYSIKGTNIFDISRKQLTETLNDTIPSGIDGLDEYLQGGGFQKGDELIVFLGRSGTGKTYTLMKVAVNAIKQGKRVGFISPEMTTLQIRRRFDSVYNEKSFKDIYENDIDGDESSFISQIRKNKAYFNIVTLKDFQREVTISKIRSYILQHKLDFLFIDGLTYIRDDRKDFDKMPRHKQIGLVAQKLKELSGELGLPIAVAVQANRMQNKEHGRVTQENVSESSEIFNNATVVLGLNWLKETSAQGYKTFGIEILKNRDCIDKKILQFNVNFGRGVFELITNDFEPEVANSDVKGGYNGFSRGFKKPAVKIVEEVSNKAEELEDLEAF